MGRRVTNRSGGGSGTGGEEQVATHILDGTDAHQASAIGLNTTTFGNNLDSGTTTVQILAEIVDNFDLTGLSGPPVGGGHVIVYEAETLTQRDTLRFLAPFLVTDDNLAGETIIDFDVDSLGLEVVETSDIGVTVPPLVAGQIPPEYIPIVAINDVFTVADEAEMLALGASQGDVAIRTDEETSYILAATPASTLGNWELLTFGASVTSVNTQTGAVVLEGEHIAINPAGFSGNLDGTVTDTQLLAAAVDALEISTGTPTGTAGGDLDGTYPDPTVAASHSGSTHADVQAAAEATAAAALAAHLADVSSVHDGVGIDIDADDFTGYLSAITTAQDGFAAADAITAADIPLDADLFINNLDETVTTVQLLGEKVDALVFGNLVESVNSLTGAVILDADAVGAVDVGLLGAPSGVATLDSSGQLNLAEWPVGLVTSVNGHAGSTVELIGADIELDADGFSGNLDGTVTNVQLLAVAVDDLVAGSGDVAAHLADTADAHDASAISILDTANEFTATNVEDALIELQTADEDIFNSLSAHLADTAGAHAASAISILDTGGDFTATDVEGALAELQTADEDIVISIAAHIADGTAAHAASAVAFTPDGSLSSSNVQDAIEEVRDEALGGTDVLSTSAGTTPAGSDKVLGIQTSALVTFTKDQLAIQSPADLLWGATRDRLRNIADIDLITAADQSGNTAEIGRTGWATVLSGTSAQVVRSTTDFHRGVAELQTGTQATGRCAMVPYGIHVPSYTQAGTWKFQAIVKIPVLSDATNQFEVRLGFVTDTTAAPTDGLYWRATHAQMVKATPADRHWECVNMDDTSNVTADDTTDGAAAIQIDTSYHVFTVEQSGGTVRFYCDDVLTVTQATNRPDDGSGLIPMVGIYKAASVTTKPVRVDAIAYDIPADTSLTNSRARFL